MATRVTLGPSGAAGRPALARRLGRPLLEPAALGAVVAIWRYLHETCALERVYYPGPGGDCCLQAVFAARQVVYLDHADPRRLPGFYPPAMRRACVLRGDFTRAPFRDASFDAAFVQRIGSRPGLLAEVSRLVRPGGLVVAHWASFWPRPTSPAARARRLRIVRDFTPLPAPTPFASPRPANALRWAGAGRVLQRRA